MFPQTLIKNFYLGSSFFGQLFNMHPDVFYMFEPLVSVDKLWGAETTNDTDAKMSILQNLFQCVMFDYNTFYEGTSFCFFKLNLPVTQDPAVALVRWY